MYESSLLLQNGAVDVVNMHMQAEDGRSSFMLSSQNGHTEITSLLLKNGADVNMQAEEGVSSLMLSSTTLENLVWDEVNHVTYS